MVNHLRPVEPYYGVHKQAKDIEWPKPAPRKDHTVMWMLVVAIAAVYASVLVIPTLSWLGIIQ